MAYQNFFAAKLYTDIGSGDTSIQLDTAPSATSGRMVLEARNPTQREIIKYTGVAGTTLTGVTRGHGGTSAKPHTKNSLIEQNLTAEDIQDLYDSFASFSASLTNWFPILSPVSSVVDNGSKSYNVVVTGADLRDRITPGMRLRLTRNTPTPTQSASLNGSNQYFSKSSPTAMTFTDDFSVSAYVKLNDYPGSGTFGIIASRFNGTSGWWLAVLPDGRLELCGFNASGSNYSRVQSPQSIPTGRWVHVAAQLDMSAFTATTTTSYTMIDGLNGPGTVSRGGTNPTALVQAGNLEIGSANASNFLNGSVAQVAIYSAKVVQSVHRASANQGLTGAESSLVSAYTLANSVNDLSANGNNLTAQNSASTTTVGSPFGNDGASSTIEYAVVTDLSYAGGDTTLVVQVPEGCTLPTTGSISSIEYSTQKIPYGFPSSAAKWAIVVYVGVQQSQSNPVQNTGYNLGGIRITVPIGRWRLGYSASAFCTTAGGVQTLTNFMGLSTTNNSFSDRYLRRAIAAVSTAAYGQPSAEVPISVSSNTTYYMVNITNQTGQNALGYNNDNSGAVIYAENEYI